MDKEINFFFLNLNSKSMYCKNRIVQDKSFPRSLTWPLAIVRMLCFQYSSVDSSGCFSGLIWLQQPNGYIFCFHPGNGSSNSASKVTEVAPPEPGSGRPFVCMSVCESVVWTLTQQGTVWLRTGIRRSCPHGVNWQSLDMQQLGNYTMYSTTYLIQTSHESFVASVRFKCNVMDC